MPIFENINTQTLDKLVTFAVIIPSKIRVLLNFCVILSFIKQLMMYCSYPNIIEHFSKVWLWKKMLQALPFNLSISIAHRFYIKTFGKCLENLMSRPFTGLSFNQKTKGPLQWFTHYTIISNQLASSLVEKAASIFSVCSINNLFRLRCVLCHISKSFLWKKSLTLLSK